MAKNGQAIEALGARIQEHTLKNGMRVILAEKHLDPVVAAMVFYRVGARNEREHEAGVSHFLEHMMFKGSSKFGKGEVDMVTTMLGGSNNAYTSWDHTAYWFELASDRWEQALEIEADRMKTLTLDAEEFDSEKAVVLEELAMRKDDPWSSLSQHVQALVFKRHPYRRPIIGYVDTLERMPVSEMRDYYQRFYHPGNATLVLCGDFDPDKALKAARKHFGKIPAGPSYESSDCYRGEVEQPAGETRLRVHWDDVAYRLCMAWPTCRVGAADDYAFDLLTTILTGGRLSRLHRNIVLEAGLATSISTTNDTRVDSGAFWLFAECAQGVAPEALEAAIDAELERIVSEPPSADELKRAKAMLRASDAYEHETVTDLAEDLGEYAVDADWRLVLEGVERTEKITAKEVQDCAARYLASERRIVGWSVPRDAQEDPPVQPRKKTKRKVKKKVARKTAKKVKR